MTVLGFVLDLPHIDAPQFSVIPVPPPPPDGEGEGAWLIDENGEYVRDENGQLIPVL